MNSFSRRKIAEYAGKQILNHGLNSKLLQQLAAYLIIHKKQNQVALLVREIEAYLAQHGIVIADIATATPLSESARTEVAKLLGNEKKISLREQIDLSLIGGIKIESADQFLDATVATRLNRLRSN